MESLRELLRWCPTLSVLSFSIEAKLTKLVLILISFCGMRSNYEAAAGEKRMKSCFFVIPPNFIHLSMVQQQPQSCSLGFIFARMSTSSCSQMATTYEALRALMTSTNHRAEPQSEMLLDRLIQFHMYNFIAEVAHHWRRWVFLAFIYFF